MIKKVFDNPLLAGIENVTPYQIASAAHLHSIEPPPMIIDDVLPAGGIMGITSFPGVGKSWLCMEIARAVCGEKKFLGHFDTLPGSVLFVGSDSSEYDYARQWTRLSATDEALFSVHASEIPDAERDLRLETENGPDWRIGPFHSARFLLQSDFMFENIDTVRRLISTCLTFEYGPYEDHYDDTGEFEGNYRRTGFRVIVFDTLSKLTTANQNDNSEMENVFRNIRLIAEATGAAIVLLHHNSKKNEFNEGSDWRGAMSQIGALDSWIQLSSSPNSKHHVKVQFKKFRGITPANFAYQMLVNDSRTASLKYHMDSGPVDKDNLAADIHDYLLKIAPKQVNISQIGVALGAKWAEKYNNDMTNLKRAIFARIEKMVLTPQPNMPLQTFGGGKRGKQKLYWYLKKDAAGAQEELEEPSSDD